MVIMYSGVSDLPIMYYYDEDGNLRFVVLGHEYVDVPASFDNMDEAIAGRQMCGYEIIFDSREEE